MDILKLKMGRKWSGIYGKWQMWYGIDGNLRWPQWVIIDDIVTASIWEYHIPDSKLILYDDVCVMDDVPKCQIVTSVVIDLTFDFIRPWLILLLIHWSHTDVPWCYMADKKVLEWYINIHKWWVEVDVLQDIPGSVIMTCVNATWPNYHNSVLQFYECGH